MTVKQNQAAKKKDETQREGASAFAAGKPDTDCPYKSNGNAADVSQKRIWWMNGYWAAHAVANVRGVTLTEMLAEKDAG